jgi:hypothetical protein
MGKINTLNDSYNLDGLIKDLEFMVKTLVIKYSNIAKEYETPESKAEADRYIAALEGKNNIYSYKSFDREVLIKAGFTEDDINNFKTIYDIPKAKVPICIKLQDMVTISEYVEQNKRSVVIFPEGTRSKTGVPKPFAESGLKLLCKYAPSAYMVPLTINNSWKMTPWGSFPLGIGNKLTFTIHPPFAIEGLSFAEIFERTEKAVVGSVRN